MDSQVLKQIAGLVRNTRVASLGTLREGEPLVSMVPLAPAPDLGHFVILASRLAQHTQDFLANPRVGLMILETDDGQKNPGELARLSIRGRIEPGTTDDPALYLARFPESSRLLALGDFAFYRIVPRVGRYIGGFGQAFNLGPDHLKQAAAMMP